MSHDTVPITPATIRDHDRQWRLGYQAGLRERRRLLVVGAVVGLVVLFRRHLHPLAALVVTFGVAVMLAPVLLAVLAVEVTRRQHLRWRSPQRTILMAASWLAGLGVAYLDLRFRFSPLVLATVPVLVLAWTTDHHRRTRREWSELASVHNIKPEDAPVVVPLIAESYRVLSTSRRRGTETRRYPDDTVRTIDVRTGRDVDGDPPF